MPTAVDAVPTYVPLWRNEPLPEPGREIVMAAHFAENGRTRWREYRVIVDTALVAADDPRRLVITAPGDDTEYLLDEDSKLTWWRYVDPATSANQDGQDRFAQFAVGERGSELHPALTTLVARLEPPEPYGVTKGDIDARYAEQSAQPTMPDAHDESITGRIRRLIAVRLRLKAIKAEEKALEAERDELSDSIIDLMIEEGMDSPPGVDGMTVYLASVYYAEKNVDPDTEEPYTSEDVLTALRESGLGGMINEGYNGNQIRALLREYETSNRELPDALARVYTLRKKREVRATPMAAQRRELAPNRF